MAVWGVVGQVLAIAVVRASMSSGMVVAAPSCRASATIRTVLVAGETADRPLCRLVQRRAGARPAPSAKNTPPGGGGSAPPPHRRETSRPGAGPPPRGPATRSPSPAGRGAGSTLLGFPLPEAGAQPAGAAREAAPAQGPGRRPAEQDPADRRGHRGDPGEQPGPAGPEPPDTGIPQHEGRRGDRDREIADGEPVRLG